MAVKRLHIGVFESCALFAVLVCGSAFADGVNGFYSENFAKSVYADANKEDSNLDGEVQEAALKEKLLSEHGDPKIDPPINVVDNAPKPFKAMMAALEAGEDQLAFSYARQYVRYLKRLQDRTGKVMGFVGLAGEREKMFAENDWQTSQQYDQYRGVLQKDLEQDPQSAASGTAELDERTRNLLEDAERAEAVGVAKIEERRKAARAGTTTTAVKQDPKVLAQKEAEDRLQVRQAMAGKVAPAPGGEIDIAMFFSPNETLGVQMLSEIDALYQKVRSDPRVKFNVFWLGTINPEQEQKLRGTYTFPLKDGNDVAKRYKVSGTPSTIYLARRTGRVYVEEGYRRFFYLDEVFGLMQGRRS